jgi:hypothetical protein
MKSTKYPCLYGNKKRLFSLGIVYPYVFGFKTHIVRFNEVYINGILGYVSKIKRKGYIKLIIIME